jgi:hypothetical protein
MFLKGCQSLLGLTNYLRFVVACDILGSRKFCIYLERVAVQKSLRTPALSCISILICCLAICHCISHLESFTKFSLRYILVYSQYIQFYFLTNNFSTTELFIICLFIVSDTSVCLYLSSIHQLSLCFCFLRLSVCLYSLSIYQLSLCFCFLCLS